jgi:hypothetical protein
VTLSPPSYLRDAPTISPASPSRSRSRNYSRNPVRMPYRMVRGTHSCANVVQMALYAFLAPLDCFEPRAGSKVPAKGSQP